MNDQRQAVHLATIEEIFFPKHLYWFLVSHARRKLRGAHRPGEERAPKAYGLLGGRAQATRVEMSHVFPLKKNLRDEPHVKPEVDRLMEETAFPSETPLDRRGWVTDPLEVMAAERECDASGAVLLGGYHMHRVAWAHDPVRDTCTEVDARLAEGSGLWMFILSMVDPEEPLLRAFFEGCNDREVPIYLGHSL